MHPLTMGLIVSACIIGLIVIISLIYTIVNTCNEKYEASQRYYPTKFPHYEIEIDVDNIIEFNSSKYYEYIYDYVQLYILDHDEFVKEILSDNETIKNRININKEIIQHSPIFTPENKQKHIENLDKQYSENNLKYVTVKYYKTITKYRQVNYVKHSYRERILIDEINISHLFLLDLMNFALETGMTTTQSEIAELQTTAKEQRRKMTKELRKVVMERDNYTCQMCGKYMPDEVGLHIDHIIPVSKGGKTELSNLQVLCSKCNGNKSDKVGSIKRKRRT